MTARALQLAERIELKGLERPDQFSSTPLAFKAGNVGTVALFRFGAAVFVGMNPLEEEGIIKGLEARLIDPLRAQGQQQRTPSSRAARWPNATRTKAAQGCSTSPPGRLAAEPAALRT